MTPRRLWTLTAMAAVALVLALITLFYAARVSSESRKADMLFAQDNRRAIVLNCHEREELKGVVRTIMETVIAFNVREGTPLAIERAETYQTILDERLGAAECIPD